VFNGELRGAGQVGKMLSVARSLYAFQDFRFYGSDLFYDGDVSARLLDRDLSRGLWPPSSR
jgi:hypothetical protein